MVILPVSETIKNVIEVLNSVYDSSINFQNLFFAQLVGKTIIDWFVYIITFQWLNDFVKIPIFLPSFAESIFLNDSHSELSFVPVESSSTFFSSSFFSGFFSCLLLYIPLSPVHFIWLRYALIDGLNAVWIIRAATFGLILGNLSLLACCLFGCTFIINFWFGLEPWTYCFGVWLVFKVTYKIASQRYLVKVRYKKEEIWTIFFIVFLCVWTDQSGIYQFFGNLSIQSGFSILDFVNSSVSVYFLGISIGSLIWPFLIHKIISRILVLLPKLIKFSFSAIVRGTSKALIIASVTLVIASFPFYESGYLFSKPLGFLPQDKALEIVSLSSKTPDAEQGRLGEKSSYTSVDTDFSFFDRGRYAGGPGAETHIESLNYREEYAWRSRIDRFSSRGLTRRKSVFDKFIKRQLGPADQALQKQRKQRKRIQQIRILREKILREREERKKQKLELMKKNELYISDDSSSSDLEDESEENFKHFYKDFSTVETNLEDFGLTSLDEVKGVFDISSDSESNDESDSESNDESDNESNDESDNESNDESDNESNDESNDESDSELKIKLNNNLKNSLNTESNDESNDESDIELDIEPTTIKLPSKLPLDDDVTEYYEQLIERFIENYTAEANSSEPEVPDLATDKMIRFSAFSEIAKFGFDSFSFADIVEIDPYEEELARDLKARFSDNIVNKLFLKFNISYFLKRQPIAHKLTSDEEIFLFKKRLALGEYFNTIRPYFDLPNSFQPLFCGPKSYTNRIYNQQFKGTLKIVERLFSIHLEKKKRVPVLSRSRQKENSDDMTKKEYDQYFKFLKKKNKKNEPIFMPLESRLIDENLRRLNDQYWKLKSKQNDRSVLKFDQPLYKDDFSKQNPLIHEELLSQMPSLINDVDVEPFLEENSSYPFFVGWDSEERKFVVTNRILNRKNILSKTSLPKNVKFRRPFLAQKKNPTKKKMFVLNEEKDTFFFTTWPVTEKSLKKNSFFSRMFSLSDELADASEDVFKYPEPGVEEETVAYTKLPNIIRRLNIELKDQPYLGVKRGGFVWPGTEPLKYKLPSFNFSIKKFFKTWKLF